MTTRFPLTLVAVLGAVLLLSACSEYNDERGRGDAGITARDASPAIVVNMPDGFSNVAIKCAGPNGVYVTTQNANGKQLTVVENDPNCADRALLDFDGAVETESLE